MNSEGNQLLIAWLLDEAPTEVFADWLYEHGVGYIELGRPLCENEPYTYFFTFSKDFCYIRVGFIAKKKCVVLL